MLAALVPPATAARAQVVSCSKFLHNRDGSWTSFVTGEVLGSRGPLDIHAGERFAQGERGARGDIARLLDRICADD